MFKKLKQWICKDCYEELEDSIFQLDKKTECIGNMLLESRAILTKLVNESDKKVICIDKNLVRNTDLNAFNSRCE